MTDKREYTVEQLAELVRLHLKTLEMNGEKTAEVLKVAAAKAVADYEAAKAKRDAENQGR